MFDARACTVRPHASERELVSVGRAFCALLAVVTLAWLPVIDLMSDQVFVYIQSISMYLSPCVRAPQSMSMSISLAACAGRRGNRERAVPSRRIEARR